jgi:hypothetical protein
MRLPRHTLQCRLALFALIVLFLFSGIFQKTQASAAEAGEPGKMSAAPDAAGKGTGDQKAATDPRDEKINELLRRVEALEKKLRAVNGETGAPLPPAAAAPPAPPVPTVQAEEEERMVRAALERTLVERSGILLSPGTLEIEPSITYVHASADNISIDGISIEDTLVIGEIISHRVRRNIVIPALTFRLGLPYDFQVEAKLPYRYEANRTVRGDSTEEFRETGGLGDIEFALSYQLLKEKGLVPDILGRVSWKTKSGQSPPGLISNELALGTGYDSLSFMLTALKVREPAAFFGSLMYISNLSVNKEEGHFDPGDMWGFNLGLALALNLDTSIHFVWEQRFSNAARLNGNKIHGSALYPGSLRIGTTYAFSPKFLLDVSVAIGLTRDAPDVQAVVAVPIRFTDVFSTESP